MTTQPVPTERSTPQPVPATPGPLGWPVAPHAAGGALGWAGDVRGTAGPVSRVRAPSPPQR